MLLVLPVVQCNMAHYFNRAALSRFSEQFRPLRVARCHAQVCSNKARDVLPRELLTGAADGDADRPLTQRETKQLMVPLIRLRQACCHPQARHLPCSRHPVLSQLQPYRGP